MLIQFVRMYKDRPLEYHNCPVNFVETLNIVRELLGPSRDGSAVKSLALPYHCDDCNRFDERMVQAKRIDMNDKNFGQPPFPCSSCGQPMIIDVLEGEYLDFF